MSKSVNRRKFIATVGAGIAGAQMVNLAGCQSTPEKSPLYDGGTVPKSGSTTNFILSGTGHGVKFTSTFITHNMFPASGRNSMLRNGETLC